MNSKFVDRGRVLLHDLMVSKTGNGVAPVRWTRQALSFVNDLTGRPLRSEDDLRRQDEELRGLRDEVASQRTGTATGSAAGKAEKRDVAPVVLYVTDQDMRTRRRLEDILRGRDIPYVVNDVSDDESSRSWALTQAQATEFPLLFVAGEPIGGMDAVMQLDVSGELRKKVFG